MPFMQKPPRQRPTVLGCGLQRHHARAAPSSTDRRRGGPGLHRGLTHTIAPSVTPGRPVGAWALWLLSPSASGWDVDVWNRSTKATAAFDLSVIFLTDALNLRPSRRR